MKKNWAVGINSNEPRSSKSTHARAISFHDTFARKRTRTNRSNAFYRSFAFAKFFHVRAVWRELFSSRQKKTDFSKIHLSWKPNQTKPTRPPKRVQHAQRERAHRERERERKREQHAPVDLRAVCFVRAMLTFKTVFFLMTIFALFLFLKCFWFWKKHKI